MKTLLNIWIALRGIIASWLVSLIDEKYEFTKLAIKVGELETIVHQVARNLDMLETDLSTTQQELRERFLAISEDSAYWDSLIRTHGIEIGRLEEHCHAIEGSVVDHAQRFHSITTEFDVQKHALAALDESVCHTYAMEDMRRSLMILIEGLKKSVDAITPSEREAKLIKWRGYIMEAIVEKMDWKLEEGGQPHNTSAWRCGLLDTMNTEAMAMMQALEVDVTAQQSLALKVIERQIAEVSDDLDNLRTEVLG